jgi:hypothetical protein
MERTKYNRAKYYPSRGGHAPGYLREVFDKFLLLMLRKKISLNTKLKIDSGTELTVAEICGLLWNCTDTLPGDSWDIAQDLPPDDVLMNNTYAAATRRLKKSLS